MWSRRLRMGSTWPNSVDFDPRIAGTVLMAMAAFFRVEMAIRPAFKVRPGPGKPWSSPPATTQRKNGDSYSVYVGSDDYLVDAARRR